MKNNAVDIIKYVLKYSPQILFILLSVGLFYCFLNWENVFIQIINSAYHILTMGFIFYVSYLFFQRSNMIASAGLISMTVIKELYSWNIIGYNGCLYLMLATVISVIIAFLFNKFKRNRKR